MSGFEEIKSVLLDADNNEDIVLVNEKGQELAFKQVYSIVSDGRLYCILAPLSDKFLKDNRMAFLFAVSEDGTLTAVRDRLFSQRIFSQYYNSLKTGGK